MPKRVAASRPPQGEADQRSARRARVAQIGGVLLVAASIPVALALVEDHDMQLLRRKWTIDGPPCPMVAQPSRANLNHRGEMATEYVGTRYRREFGAVECQDLPAGGWLSRTHEQVCHFNGPGVIRVAA